MRITKDLAAQIRNKAKAILEQEVIVASSGGIIVAAESNTGKFVAEALRSSQENARTQGAFGPHQVEWFPFVYEEEVMGVFGLITDDKQLSSETTSLLQGLAEVIVSQYFLLDRAQPTVAIRADFIKEMLTSASIDEESIYRQADIMQLNLRSPQAVILTHIAGFEKEVTKQKSNLSAEEQQLEIIKSSDKLSEQLFEGFKSFPHNVICYIGDDTFVVLKGIGGSTPNTVNTIRFLKEKGQYIYELLRNMQHNSDVTVGVGQYYQGLGGLRKSYQDAALALQVGRKVWKPNAVYHIKQVGMFISLANVNQDRKAELAYQILHPLLKDQQLFKTVKEFLASGLNLTEASQKLHIHRNTLIYRLDTTKKLINLDPRHFDDALQIKLGLMFYQPN